MSVGELKTTFDSFEDPGSSSNMVSTSPASTDPSSLPQQHSRFSKPSSIYSHNATSSADTSIPFPPSAPSINETISKIYQKASGTRTHSRSSSFGASRHGASSVHANSSTPEFAPSLTFMKSNASVGGLTQGIHDHDRPETTSPSPANAMLHRLERKRAAFQHAHIHNREVALTGPRANILRAASPMEVHGFKPISTEWKPPTQYMTSANPSILQSLTYDILRTYQGCNPEYQYERKSNPRRVLTKPSKPTHNDGYDNEDWDYILYVNDILGVQEGQQYRILETLGQGTFGQVVKCENIKTKELVAIKVIKNKLAYYNQSLVEVTILNMLNTQFDPDNKHRLVRMRDTFVFRSHLCIIFEMLSVNLFELIKQNNYRGLSIHLVRLFISQLLDSLVVLNQARIIHCDLKPENILLKSLEAPDIKVIDFGSACHENETIYTYIQSRFYRAPEVLLGLPYTSSIDMWSLGCIAAELYLGLPLFPGSSEFNQLSRIVEMLGVPPTYMCEKGKSSSQFFDKIDTPTGRQHVLKSIQTYMAENNTTEQPSKRYFNGTTLAEVINGYPLPRKGKELEKELEARASLLDFLEGVLNLNPLERWSPQQAKMHPFITGERFVGKFIPPMRTLGALPNSLTASLRASNQQAQSEKGALAAASAAVVGSVSAASVRIGDSGSATGGSGLAAGTSTPSSNKPMGRPRATTIGSSIVRNVPPQLQKLVAIQKETGQPIIKGVGTGREHETVSGPVYGDIYTPDDARGANAGAELMEDHDYLLDHFLSPDSDKDPNGLGSTAIDDPMQALDQSGQFHDGAGYKSSTYRQQQTSHHGSQAAYASSTHHTSSVSESYRSSSGTTGYYPSGSSSSEYTGGYDQTPTRRLQTNLAIPPAQSPSMGSLRLTPPSLKGLGRTISHPGLMTEPTQPMQPTQPAQPSAPAEKTGPRGQTSYATYRERGSSNQSQRALLPTLVPSSVMSSRSRHSVCLDTVKSSKAYLPTMLPSMPEKGYYPADDYFDTSMEMDQQGYDQQGYDQQGYDQASADPVRQGSAGDPDQRRSQRGAYSSYGGGRDRSMGERTPLNDHANKSESLAAKPSSAVRDSVQSIDYIELMDAYQDVDDVNHRIAELSTSDQPSRAPTGALSGTTSPALPLSLDHSVTEEDLKPMEVADRLRDRNNRLFQSLIRTPEPLSRTKTAATPPQVAPMDTDPSEQARRSMSSAMSTLSARRGGSAIQQVVLSEEPVFVESEDPPADLPADDRMDEREDTSRAVGDPCGSIVTDSQGFPLHKARSDNLVEGRDKMKPLAPSGAGSVGAKLVTASVDTLKTNRSPLRGLDVDPGLHQHPRKGESGDRGALPSPRNLTAHGSDSWDPFLAPSATDVPADSEPESARSRRSTPSKKASASQLKHAVQQQQDASMAAAMSELQDGRKSGARSLTPKVHRKTSAVIDRELHGGDRKYKDAETSGAALGFRDPQMRVPLRRKSSQGDTLKARQSIAGDEISGAVDGGLSEESVHTPTEAPNVPGSENDSRTPRLAVKSPRFQSLDNLSSTSGSRESVRMDRKRMSHSRSALSMYDATSGSGDTYGDPLTEMLESSTSQFERRSSRAKSPGMSLSTSYQERGHASLAALSPRSPGMAYSASIPVSIPSGAHKDGAPHTPGSATPRQSVSWKSQAQMMGYGAGRENLSRDSSLGTSRSHSIMNPPGGMGMQNGAPTSSHHQGKMGSGQQAMTPGGPEPGSSRTSIHLSNTSATRRQTLQMSSGSFASSAGGAAHSPAGSFGSVSSTSSPGTTGPKSGFSKAGSVNSMYGRPKSMHVSPHPANYPQTSFYDAYSSADLYGPGLPYSTGEPQSAGAVMYMPNMGSQGSSAGGYTPRGLQQSPVANMLPGSGNIPVSPTSLTNPAFGSAYHGMSVPSGSNGAAMYSDYEHTAYAGSQYNPPGPSTGYHPGAHLSQQQQQQQQQQAYLSSQQAYRSAGDYAQGSFDGQYYGHEARKSRIYDNSQKTAQGQTTTTPGTGGKAPSSQRTNGYYPSSAQQPQGGQAPNGALSPGLGISTFAAANRLEGGRGNEFMGGISRYMGWTGSGSGGPGQQQQQQNRQQQQQQQQQQQWQNEDAMAQDNPRKVGSRDGSGAV